MLSWRHFGATLKRTLILFVCVGSFRELPIKRFIIFEVIGYCLCFLLRLIFCLFFATNFFLVDLFSCFFLFLYTYLHSKYFFEFYHVYFFIITLFLFFSFLKSTCFAKNLSTFYLTFFFINPKSIFWWK